MKKSLKTLTIIIKVKFHTLTGVEKNLIDSSLSFGQAARTHLCVCFRQSFT